MISSPLHAAGRVAEDRGLVLNSGQSSYLSEVLSGVWRAKWQLHSSSRSPALAGKHGQSVFPVCLVWRSPELKESCLFFSVEESYSPAPGCFLLCLQGLALGRVWWDAPAKTGSGDAAQCSGDAEVFLRWKSPRRGHPVDADWVHESRSEPCSHALGIISFLLIENWLKSNNGSQWNHWCSGILHHSRI